MHYSQRVTQAIPPSAALPISLLPASGADNASAGGQGFAATAMAAAQGAGPVATPTALVQTAQVAQIVAAAQAALAHTVNVSPQAQQAVKIEAFNQLVANLVNQIQPGNATLPTNWPAGGVTAPLQAMVTALLQQATAGQPLPQQLVSVQSWPTVLTQAVLQHAGQAALANAALAGGAVAHGAGSAAQAAGTGSSTATSTLPALQNWLVQQGVVQASDGERAFTLTLRVPVAWAQAQAALGAALPGASSASNLNSLNGTLGLSAAPILSGSLQLPFSGSVQQLASGAMGLVMQPQALPGSPAAVAAQAMRTSAILQLEFQPLAAAVQSAQAASVYMPAHMLPQDVQAMLQNKGTDPWLLMAQAQADESGKKQPRNANEHNQNFCNRAGCQYQGRAICAQPFCAEMNYLWSVDRAQRRNL